LGTSVVVRVEVLEEVVAESVHEQDAKASEPAAGHDFP
jgi:hypothetical protein